MPAQLYSRTLKAGLYNVFDMGHTVVIPQQDHPAPPIEIPQPEIMIPTAMMGGPRGGVPATGPAMKTWNTESIMLPDDIARDIDYTEQPISRPYPKLAPSINRPGEY